MPQLGWQPQVRLPHSDVGPVDEIRPVGERAHERDREPVARRLAEARLVLHVVREVRERVALGGAALRRDLFVATREGHRLERQEVDLPRVVERELHDTADLLVVDAVDNRDDRHDVDTGAPQILDGAQLDVEQVAHEAMRVRGVADPVELQIGIAQSGLERRLREFLALGELDPVRRRLHRVVAHLLRVAHGIQEVRRHRRLAARELHRHLPAGLQRDRVVEHRLDLVPRELVDEADLVRVHEARVAHHVAAVRQVDRQDRAAAVLDRAAAVVVELLVVVGSDVAAREGLLEVLEERRVDGHHVLEVAVDRAVLEHHDLAVLLGDRGLDLADLLVQQNLVVLLAVDDRLPRFTHAVRTQRVGLSRPAKRRLHLLPRFLQRQVGPFGREGTVPVDAVDPVENRPGALGRKRQPLLGVLDWLVHAGRIPASHSKNRDFQ